MSRILIEIHEGQIVRNLLENGLLRLLTAGGNQVLLVTPGARYPAFVERFSLPGVELRDLNLIFRAKLSRSENYEGALGKWLNRKGYHGLRRELWRRVGQPSAASHAAEAALIDEWKPDVVVSTHLSQIYGRGLVAAARQRGIPTVGNLNSWDNAWKGLRIFPDTVTCWSDNNREELVRLNGLNPDQVRVIGAPAFDAYLAPDAQWSRADLCQRLGLEQNRPILLFATLGQFSQQIDETNPLEVLLRAVDAGSIPGRPQIILRMHPWSRDSYFAPFMRHEAVIVSRYENYVPGLGWSPTRDEAILAGNLLRHADVVISPGSTMSIEPALFDTPTVVPVFNEYMPEVFEDYFEQTWIKQHFSRLYQNDWLPIVRSGAEMVAAINHALSDKTWYHQGREHIREAILGSLDGKATERFAAVIVEACKP
ncbi:MAG: glycosyltransferase [Chloroflexota bacterium]